MTGLLVPPRRRTDPAAADSPARPLWLAAGFAGIVAACSVLVGCMTLGLVGWFTSDAGAHGDTRDALRVGADAWLLAHGTPLRLEAATISLVPLGLTALCLYTAYRAGRWAALTAAPEPPSGVLLAGSVLVGLYGVIALVTAVLASLAGAELSPGRAFVGGVVVAALGGGGGLASASVEVRRVLVRVPEGARVVLCGALGTALLVAAAGSALVFAALVADFGSAANVLSRLHPDTAGAALYTGVVAGFAPNAALLGVAYLLGPGFGVGVGTVVSPGAVVLGPVPAFPLLAALPAEGPGPSWAVGLVGVPVLLAAVGVGLAGRRTARVQGYEAAVLRGLLGGALGGVLVTGAVALSGGSAGPGRMAGVGAPFLDTLGAGTVALAVGGLVGGLVTTWWRRRHAVPGEDMPRTPRKPDTEDTVRL